MPMAVLVMGIGLAMFESAAKDQQRVEDRSRATTAAMTSLERMTREVRQADWVQFESSREVYLQTRVRAATGDAETRLVRYTCASSGCTRYEGVATGWPIPTTASLASTGTFAENLLNVDIFEPRALDQATGTAKADYLKPDTLWIRLKFEVEGFNEPVELQDGASLRNATRFIASS